MNRQSATSNPGDWLLGSIKQNPEGLLLLAAGAALLMRTARSSTRSAPQAEDSTGSSDFSGTAGNSSESASDMAGRAREKVTEFASSAADRVSGFASAASDRASKASQTVNEKTAKLASQTKASAQDFTSRMLQEQPLVVAVAGLAAGAALAAAFPGTQMEKQTLGPIGEQVGEAAQRVGDQLKQATSAAGETLKNAARERGLNQEGLKEVASEVAGAFSGSMSGTSSPDNHTTGKPEAPATKDPRF